MSSSEADVDKFQFQTRIEWPEKGKVSSKTIEISSLIK